MFAGITLFVIGAAITFLGKSSLPFGRLPGDFLWKGRHTTIYFPLATCLLLSIVGTLILWLLNRR